jgi:superfamily II DNA or RNA helicase
MSVCVDIDSILIEKRRKILSDLNVKTIVKKGKQKYSSSHTFDVYEIKEDDVYIPFAYYYQHLEQGFPNQDIVYPNSKTKFKLSLFERQKDIREESLQILNDTHSLVLSLFCGWGKTFYAIYLACKIGLKTIVFVNRIILIDQWYVSIKKACGEDTIVQILTAKTKIDPDADFYIINVINVAKRDVKDFSSIGLLIADEIHLLCTEKFSKAFGYVYPKYLIGLTATPVRSDGKDRVIELYCGPNIIYRPLNAMFNAYLLNTKFVPKPEKNENGDLNWNSVLECQCMSKKRNELLIDIVRYFSHRNILITCKRKDHAEILVRGLQLYGEDVDSYMGSDKIVNYDCRILVVTYSKASTGFDHPKLDMLLIAGDLEEQFMQCLGRIFRREWHFPIVIDPIDSFRPLKKHADSRCEIYKQAGGQVKKMENYFNCFDQWRKILATNLTPIYIEMDISY